MLTAACILFCAILPLAATAQSILRWNGSVDTKWDVSTTANWLIGASPVVYTNGAAVLFDDTAAGSGAVSIPALVQPAGITVSNVTKAYNFTGPGVMAGSAGFSKLGSNRLTLGSNTAIVTTGNFMASAGSLVLNGANLQSNYVGGELWVGNTTTAEASIQMSNSTLSVASWLAVGRGNGTVGYASSLTLQDSAIACNNASLGYRAGITGNLQSPSLTLNGNSRLIVGGGTGFNLGESGGSSATVNLNDNSVMTCSQRVLLGMGSGSTGTIVIANSAAMTNGGYSSVGAVGTGFATLKGNAVWQSLTDFNVADTTGSQGTLFINDNSRLILSTLYVGKAVDSTGIVNQSGGSVLRSGGGEWRIGGNVSSGANQLGIYNLSGGTLDVGSGNLQIGARGTGEFNQTAGTVLVGGWPVIARFGGSVGTLNISGGSFNQTGSGTALIVGEEGQGTLTLSASGNVNVANNLAIGYAAGASGTVNLNGGTLTARRVLKNDPGAYAELNLNGGTLRAGTSANSSFLTGLDTVTVQSGGAVIDSGTNVITIAQALLKGTGNGGLTKLGSGTLKLSDTLSYTGPTLVSAGKLMLAAPGTPASANFNVASGAGFGVQLLGAGSRVITTNLTLGAGSGATLDFDFGWLGNQPAAALYVPAVLTLGGTVTVNLEGADFTVGQFPLIQYGTLVGSGRFVLGTLPYGMAAQLLTNSPNHTIDIVVTSPSQGLPWQMKQAPLMTDWAQQVNPTNTWPEYPRPQMQRTNWLNLNGIWQWQAGNAGDPLPAQNLSGAILVPFCMESAISGVMEHHERAWYKRTFTLPPGWSGQRTILHFDAVDWECEPYLNGISLGIHRGGYDPFSFDVTPYLTNTGPQTLVVRVYDPTDSGGAPVILPVGKQRLSPSGIWYTPCSGIWQSVWLEPVPASSISDIHLVPDIDTQRLKVNVTVSGPAAGFSIVARAFDGSNQVALATASPGADFNLVIPNPKLWSPTNPFLYDLTLSLVTPSNTVDTVSSYFGMRKISLGTNDGFVKMFLNNQFVFQFGPLDQGYWPDGIYTPPTDLAMRYDLEQSKALGFNMIRKHVKVEPARWYYYADKLGLLVWQDMPSMHAVPGSSDSPTRNNFETELSRLIRTHWNYPSIVVWTVFNEGWGQYDTVRISSDVMALDPSRLVNCASGWTYFDVGHMEDSHSYPNPSCPQNDTRAVVNGEYGGVGLGITNHTWAAGWGYVGAVDGEDLTARFENFSSQLAGFANDQGLSAAVYTQITDVETELNGLYTYDRKVFKPLLRRMQQAIVQPMGIYEFVPLVPTSQTTPQTWRYTLSSPPGNWYTAGFNASSWNLGPGGFGTAGTPGSVIGTTWNTSDIWLRRSFDVTGLTPQQISNLVLRVHHDEDVEVYLNGVAAASASGYTTAYGTMPISAAAKAAIQAGPNNVIAVHCHQTGGGQYIDVGIDLATVVVATPEPPAIPSWPENGTGLNAEYFVGTNLVNRVLLKTDSNLNFDWGSSPPAAGVPADQFSVRWSSRIQPRYSEVYTFHLTTDDGCRLWIDGQLLIDKWINDAGSDRTGSILLTGGQHYDIRIDYYENTGNALVRLEWQSASQAREIVPQGVLFPNLPPVLDPIGDRTLVAGQTLVMTNSASDPDIPAQSLSFSLATAPAGAAINSTNGILTWRPAISQSPGTYPFQVAVTDNGTPSLAATQAFQVTVTRPTQPTLGLPAWTGERFQMVVGGDIGPDYAVYASTNLAIGNWSLLLTTNPPVLPFLFVDPLATNYPQRYYQIQLGPP